MDNKNSKLANGLRIGAIISALCLVLLIGVLVFLELDTAGNTQPEELYVPEATIADNLSPTGEDIPETQPTAPEVSVEETKPVKPETEPTSPHPTDYCPPPVDSTPTQPVPTEPAPTAPAPTEPAPTAPAPTEPAPTEPEPTEPEPTEPEPTEPEQDDSITVLSGEVSAQDGTVTQDASFSDGDVSAQIPAGVQLEADTTTLVLTITEKDSSDSGVALEDGQVIKPLDVHIEGISQQNTQPVTVCLGKILPNGMNIGNVTLYHVENGTSNAMTQVLTAAELDTHNEFYYDPVTGDTTVAMATFSEVAVVSDTESVWNGAFDNFTGSGTEDDPYIIANADQLAQMSKLVSDDENYASAHYKLISNVNLNGEEAQKNDNKSLVFYPIGYWAEQDGTNSAGEVWYGAGNSFSGTFDGNGNTISNSYQNTWLMDGNYDAGYWNTAMGLFGALYNATIKNLTVDNFQSDGEFTPTGCIAAYAGGPEMLFENIHLTNCNPRVYNTGNGGLVGLNYNSSSEGSYDHITFKNVTVDQTNKISALWGSYDVSCGGILGRLRENSKHDGTNTVGQKNTVTFDNCYVAAIMDVNNDCCANYQYYQYRYSGMLIGTVDYVGDVPAVGAEDVISVNNNCTVTYGDWNEYWYCELVANSLASYTHDHQFSRLTEIANISEIQDENGNWNTEGSFVLPNADNTAAECYHIFKNSEGNLYQHFHDVADESNLSIYETTDINGDGQLNDLKEDRQRYYIPFAQLWTGYGWGSSPMYEFDGITVADGGTVKSEPKFASKGVTTVTQNEEVKLSDLVDLSVSESKLSKSTLAVFVSPVGDESTVTANISINTNTWGDSTLTFSGTGTAKIVITDYFYCTPTEIIVSVGERVAVQKFATKFTGDFLYRVGNDSSTPVALSSLFAQNKDYSGSIGTVDVAIENIDGTAGGTYTANAAWGNGTIKFTGTGVVKVTITDNDYCIPAELVLEVVDAYNRTTASFSGNSVLLNDVSTSSSLSTSGVIYGNGFTVNMENAPISDSSGAVFHLYDGAILKNLNIVGKEFTTVAMTVNNTNYGVSAVRAWGTVVIENCYISGCRSAIYAAGTELTIKDSVIANGVYANIDFGAGILNLHNVTTINEPHTVNGTTIVGLGIVGNMTASAGRQLNITGTLTQYNWVSKADCDNIKASGVNSIFESVFTDNKYAAFRYTYNGTTYANTGILSLCSDFGASSATGIPSNYSGMDVSAAVMGVSADGYAWAPDQAGTLTAEDMKYHGVACEPVSGNQGTSYIPSSFDYTAAGLEQESGVVQISYESGDSYILSNDTMKTLFTAKKYGQDLSYTITMNGADYTNRDIVFDATASQTYTITYTVTDNLVYDKNGTLTGETYTVSKDLKVFATVVDKGADAPTFTFYYGTNGSASAGTPHTTQPTNSYTGTIKQVGEAYYIMPNVSATTENAIGSQTVDGVTVYYPIVDGINVRSGNTLDYDFTRYYPIFKAVKISDNGTEYSYTGTTEMPATVAWVSATIDDGNGASALNDGFGLYNNQYLCKIQKKAGDKESGGTSVVKFSYVALDGNTYNYYVGFRFYDENEGGICVTGDTLVALADGSHKRADEITYSDELLVWNFFTGEYDVATAAILFYHGDDLHEVLKLTFDDGTEVKVINNHGFFDVASNNWVFIDKNNAESFIGHDFVKTDADGYSTVKLVDYAVIEEYTGSYSIQTAQHNNFMVEGMFSITMPAYEGWFDYFEIGEGMKYDEEKMQADIEKYGLYTYEDFAEYVTYEQFIAFNGPYLKVLVGRGVVTYEQILELIETYVAPL